MGFIVLPDLYPAWDAACQAKSCRVLQGSLSPLLSLSLFSASKEEIFSSSGLTAGPWCWGRDLTTCGADEAPTKQWKMCLCGNELLEAGLLLSLPADTTLLPRVCNTSLSRFQGVLHWQVSHAEMEAMNAKFLNFKVVPRQPWANLSQFWLYFPDMHICGCSATFSTAT